MPLICIAWNVRMPELSHYLLNRVTLALYLPLYVPTFATVVRTSVG